MFSRDTKLVIFDCDGVLVDSETISAEVLIKLLSEAGINLNVQYVWQNFVGKGLHRVFEIISDKFDVQLSDQFEHAYRIQLSQELEKRLKATNGIVDVLENLSCKICVATGSAPERVAQSLKVTGLDKYFTDRVFTSSQVEHTKPAPDLFLFAADQMGEEPENCLVIEDSLVGLQAGLSANMTTIRYVGASHLQNFSSLPEAMADKVNVLYNWSEFVKIEK